MAWSSIMFDESGVTTDNRAYVRAVRDSVLITAPRANRTVFINCVWIDVIASPEPGGPAGVMVRLLFYYPSSRPSAEGPGVCQWNGDFRHRGLTIDWSGVLDINLDFPIRNRVMVEEAINNYLGAVV